MQAGLSSFPFQESGPVAQLGARFHGMEEVVGSNPTRSTKDPFIADKRLGCLSICGGNLFTLGLCLRMAALGRGVFNFCVDLPSHQEGQAGYIKPDQ